MFTLQWNRPALAQSQAILLASDLAHELVNGHAWKDSLTRAREYHAASTRRASQLLPRSITLIP